MGVLVGGRVEPKVVYQPHLVITTWFKTWAIKCGSCDRDVVTFAFFGKPRCPFCRIVNVPNMVIVC